MLLTFCKTVQSCPQEENQECLIFHVVTVKYEAITLGTHWLGHGTRVAQALCVDGAHHEQVDSVGSQALNGELGGFDVICYSLPAVTHRLAERCRTEKKKSILQMSTIPIKT